MPQDCGETHAHGRLQAQPLLNTGHRRLRRDGGQQRCPLLSLQGDTKGWERPQQPLARGAESAVCLLLPWWLQTLIRSSHHSLCLAQSHGLA